MNASANKAELEKTSSTSICRLRAVASALADPQNVYATVNKIYYAGNQEEHADSADFQKEYRDSEPVSSNVATAIIRGSDQRNGCGDTIASTISVQHPLLRKK